MELVEGQPLVTILHEEGHLPVDWTLHVLGQSADGLSAAHAAGVVHRDIKPGNLIVRPDGVVKLTDFGIARARDATPLTRTGMVVGTAQYLSPEQAQGFEVTAASDVYSLGRRRLRVPDRLPALRRHLAGRHRAGAHQPAAAAAARRGARSPSASCWSAPCEKQPEDRFDDGAAFAAAIRAVAAAVGSAARPPGPAWPPPPVAATQVVAMPEELPEQLPADEPSTQVLDAAPIAAAAATGPHTAARPMPPLQGPPTGGDRWDDDGARRARRTGPRPRPALAVAGRRRWSSSRCWSAWRWIVFSGGDGDGDGGRSARHQPPRRRRPAADRPPPPSSPSTRTALLGRDVDEATARARGAGLHRRDPRGGDGGPAAVAYGAELAAGGIAAVYPARRARSPPTPRSRSSTRPTAGRRPRWRRTARTAATTSGRHGEDPQPTAVSAAPSSSSRHASARRRATTSCVVGLVELVRRLRRSPRRRAPRCPRRRPRPWSRPPTRLPGPLVRRMRPGERRPLAPPRTGPGAVDTLPDGPAHRGPAFPLPRPRGPAMTTPQVLGERYEIGGVLGRGGMAEVHRGRDTRLGREVAVKVLRQRPGPRPVVPGAVPPRGAGRRLAEPPGDRRRLRHRRGPRPDREHALHRHGVRRGRDPARRAAPRGRASRRSGR